MKYLVAGLGNIGQDYENTRHNIGFDILDTLAEKESLTFHSDRLAFHSEYKFKGRVIHLIKPTTYMNLSGKAVRYWMTSLKVPIEKVLIITDDLALPFGKIRIRKSGSHGGHNGLKNIIEELGTNQFPRLRFGISDDFYKGAQVNYVLSPWGSEERNELPDLINRSIEAIQAFAAIGIERAMNQYN